MTNLARMLLLAASVATTTISAQNVSVTFRVDAPNLPDSAKVYITGSEDALGSWNPAKVALTPVGNHQWSITLPLKSPVNLEYKLTLGSWDREAANAKGESLPNFILKTSKDTVATQRIANWLNGEKKAIVGQVTGEVRYHRQLKGEGIEPRDIIVWLPKGYDEHPNKRYPVLYMHDGQNIIDPATSSFGHDWQIDEAADSLIGSKKVDPFIVVGIYSTTKRMQEYVPGDLGTRYMKFVTQVVKPLIDSAYRTKPQAKYTAVGGSSAGGIIAFMLAWEHPNLFAKAICMSPAFKIESIDYVKNVLTYSGRKKRLLLYIDNGGIGLEERLQPGIDDMLRALDQKGYRRGKDYIWVRDANAQHNEPAWAKRIPYALQIIMGN